MPFYQCQTPEGLLDEEKRAKLANEITRIHCETTGAPKMFVHVAFTEAKRGTCYSGGELSKVSIVNATWRAGRPIELKQTFLKTVAEMWRVKRARTSRTCSSPSPSCLPRMHLSSVRSFPIRVRKRNG